MGLEIFTDLLFLSLTFSYTGKALLGITVINVHSHIVKEHKIDPRVLTYMRKEKVFGVTGVLFITLGYILELKLLGYLF
jgi:hypothetical protein